MADVMDCAPVATEGEDLATSELSRKDSQIKRLQSPNLEGGWKSFQDNHTLESHRIYRI